MRFRQLRLIELTDSLHDFWAKRVRGRGTRAKVTVASHDTEIGETVDVESSSTASPARRPRSLTSDSVLHVEAQLKHSQFRAHRRDQIHH